MTKSAAQTKQNAFKLVTPKGVFVNISKIHNPVDPKNLVKRKPKKITDLVQLAEQNSSVMASINQLKAQKKQFSLSAFGISGRTKLSSVVFDEIVQRDLVLPHIAKTLKVFDPSLTSPVFIADVKGTGYCYDTMHGMTEFALLAKNGLISGVDPQNYLDTDYASYTIPNATPGLPAFSAMTRNGLGQKKWTSIDHHKTKVGLARQYPTKYGNLFAKEVRLQNMCETYEAIPVSLQSSYSGKAGTISRVDALYKYEEFQVEFTLERHKAHWHGTKLDESAYGYYGNMIAYAKSVGWTKKETNKLSDNLDSIIFDFFADLANCRTEVMNTHERWFRACNPLTKKVPNPGDDCFLAIVQKIYVKLNGNSQQVTSHAYNYVHTTNDIYDFLDDQIKIKVDQYVTNNITW
jgi:hypothetical protein